MRACSLLTLPVWATLALTPATGTLPASLPTTSVVASGPARSLGEPVAAQTPQQAVAAATVFGGGGAAVHLWSTVGHGASWQALGALLPAGFSSSYDAAAAALPDGSVAVVAGAGPPGTGSCLVGGSVALTRVSATGVPAPAVLVDDERGRPGFDDRPTVAAGPGGTLWVAWSHGTSDAACDVIGHDDRPELAVSHDGGASFTAPYLLPAPGGGADFGVRLAPLGGGGTAVSWTRLDPSGEEAVVVTTLGRSGRAAPAQDVLTGQAPPQILPGASFYSFPVGDIAALGGGQLALAAPVWVDGQSLIEIATGGPGTGWATATVAPPPGTDLLLPAITADGPGRLRLVVAVHARAGDRLGYASTVLGVSPGSPPHPLSGLQAITADPAGPGFFELGEELTLASGAGRELAAEVLAGPGGASLLVQSWPQPASALPSPVPAPRTSGPLPSAASDPGGGGNSGGGVTGWLLLGGIGASGLAAGTLAAGARRRARRSRSAP
ncbi:MAG: hypothetical protein ACYDAQ_11365 [Mycobacteriales bacterium]